MWMFPVIFLMLFLLKNFWKTTEIFSEALSAELGHQAANG